MRPEMVSSDKPDSSYAVGLVRNVLGENTERVSRFPTGRTHHVYDVVTESGRTCVLRISIPSNGFLLRGAVYWSNMLRPIGVPLPRIIHHSVDGHDKFPFLILDRIPGNDLGRLYNQLSQSDKVGIVDRLVEIQRKLHALPPGKGYGVSFSYGSYPFSTYQELVRAEVDKNKQRIRRMGIFNSAFADEIEARMEKFLPYFSQVKPRPYLPDTTTKNVMIDEGRLTGIVDVDYVVFGDPLLTIALTRTILLRMGYNTEYTDYWCRMLNLDTAQYEVIDLYSAVWCLNFMGGIRQQSQGYDPDRISRLNKIMQLLLKNLQ